MKLGGLGNIRDNLTIPTSTPHQFTANPKGFDTNNPDGPLPTPQNISDSLMSGKFRNNLVDTASSDSFGMGQDMANTGLSLWNSTSSNPVYQGQDPYGPSMGASVSEGHVMDMLQSVLQRMGINTHGILNQNTNPALASQLANGMTGGLMTRSVQLSNNPGPTLSESDPQTYNQLGNQIGQQMNAQMTLNAITSVDTNPGNGAVTGGSDHTRAMMGQYMDQHPAVYGSPETQTPANWNTALSQQMPMNESSFGKVDLARNDLNTALNGGAIGANHPAVDSVAHTMMTADANTVNQRIADNERGQYIAM